MNIRKFVTGSLVALTVFAGIAIGASKVEAAQIPWNGGNLPSLSTPVFNTYTDMPYGNGNEADFVRLRNSNGDPTVRATDSPFTDPLNAACNVGDMYDVRTYMHNGADDDLNDNGAGSAVAHGVRVALNAPLGQTDNEFEFTSTISASNAASVTDTGTLDCGDKEVQLKLVANTVKVYSQPYGWRDLADGTVNGSTAVGSPTFGSGDFWGCWQYVTVIVYTVQVQEVPEEPVYSCDLLTPQSLGSRRFRYTVRYTARNGATFKNVTFNFGDNSSNVTTTNTTVEHAYAKDGDYTTRATVAFMVDGEEVTSTGQACTAEVTANTPVDNCPIPGKTHLPKNSPECKNVENCPIPGKTHLPTNSPECVLPNTGIGSVFGLFTATTVAGAAAHRVFNRFTDGQ